MPTTTQDIRRWIERGIAEGASDMVVMCDTFDYEDYPVYYKHPDLARSRVNNPGSMQTVMEVYNLKGDIENQLSRGRCNEYSDS